jgi:hypothetical protein
MSESIKTRCPSCGRLVRSLQIDDTEERVLVSGKAIEVAIQVPGCEGFTVATAWRRHLCPRRRPVDRERLGR